MLPYVALLATCTVDAALASMPTPMPEAVDAPLDLSIPVIPPASASAQNPIRATVGWTNRLRRWAIPGPPSSHRSPVVVMVASLLGSSLGYERVEQLDWSPRQRLLRVRANVSSCSRKWIAVGEREARPLTSCKRALRMLMLFEGAVLQGPILKDLSSLVPNAESASRVSR